MLNVERSPLRKKSCSDKCEDWHFIFWYKRNLISDTNFQKRWNDRIEMFCWQVYFVSEANNLQMEIPVIVNGIRKKLTARCLIFIFRACLTNLYWFHIEFWYSIRTRSALWPLNIRICFPTIKLHRVTTLMLFHSEFLK